MNNDVRRWTKAIVKKLRKSEVYYAVGDELKNAMISDQVMHIMLNQMAGYRSSAETLIEVYQAVRQELMERTTYADYAGGPTGEVEEETPLFADAPAGHSLESDEGVID